MWPSSWMIVAKQPMTIPISGTFSTTNARAEPTPSETQNSRSIDLFFRFFFCLGAGAMTEAVAFVTIPQSAHRTSCPPRASHVV